MGYSAISTHHEKKKRMKEKIDEFLRLVFLQKKKLYYLLLPVIEQKLTFKEGKIPTPQKKFEIMDETIKKLRLTSFLDCLSLYEKFKIFSETEIERLILIYKDKAFNKFLNHSDEFSYPLHHQIFQTLEEVIETKKQSQDQLKFPEIEEV